MSAYIRAALDKMNWKVDCLDEYSCQLFVYEFHGIEVPNNIRNIVYCQMHDKL